MNITSPAFEPNGAIPQKYTCDGDEVSPPLSWSDVPEGIQSFALVVEDPDVPAKVREDNMWNHWLVWNISADVRGVGEGETPAGIVGKNTGGETDFQGMCPPDKEHRYIFKLYALDTELDLDGSASKEALQSAMEGHILAESELIGRYNRPSNPQPGFEE